MLWDELKDKGNASFKQGDYDNAVTWYSEAISAKDDEAPLYSNRAAAYLKMSKFQDALMDAEKSIALDPMFLRIYPRQHAALCNLGRFTDAAREMGKAVDAIRTAFGTDTEDAKNLRELQLEADKYTQSMDEARKALAENNPRKAESTLLPTVRSLPTCPSVLMLFAEARAPTAPDDANNSMLAFARTHDGDPNYLYIRALCAYYRGQDGLKNAQAILRQALEYDPDNSKSRILLKKIRALELSKENGNTAFKERRYQDATKFYSEAIDMDSSNRRMNATLRGNRSASRLEAKDLNGALLDCDFAIQNGNDGAKMFARRSRIYESLEKMEEALRDLQQAAERDDAYGKEVHQLKIRIKRAKRKDYYKILSIEQREADEHSIKRAYKKSALIWHPDKWAHSSEAEKTTAEEKFKEVGEAFAVLSDPRKKQMYDNGQLDDNVEGSGGMGGGGGMGHNEDIMQMFNMMFAGGGMGGMGGGRGGRGRPPPGFQFSGF